MEISPVSHCIARVVVGVGEGSGTDCGILDPVTSQWWPVREGRVRQTSGTRDNKDIPLRPFVKQPALMLHKYLSEKREESVLVFTHTPQGLGLTDQRAF